MVNKYSIYRSSITTKDLFISLSRMINIERHLGPVHIIQGQLIAPGQLTDPGVNFVSVRHLQRTYSAIDTGVMQGLEKHNLARITNAPAAFLIQL